jgi:hypothetical protein
MYNKKELNDEVCKELQIKTSLSPSQLLPWFLQKKNFINTINFPSTNHGVSMTKFLPSWIHEALDCLYNSEYTKTKELVEPFTSFCPYANYILCELAYVQGIITESETERATALEFCKKAESWASNIHYTDENLKNYLNQLLGKDANTMEETDFKNWKISIKLVKKKKKLTK